MQTTLTLQSIQAREVLDSRGFPTVEVEITAIDPRHTGETLTGRAIVPSGASTGEGEALELRDGDKARYQGKGVQKAVANVNGPLAQALQGQSFDLDPAKSQAAIDAVMLKLDGTPNKAKLGANAILGVSMAFLRVLSAARREPTYRLIARIQGTEGRALPVPMMNILNGGKHADNGLAIQEFMIVPWGFSKFSEALRAGSEIFHTLKKILHDKKLSTGVGDEGGFAPEVPGAHPHESVIQMILEAVKQAGYEPGKQVALAIDSASSEFSKTANGQTTYQFEGQSLSSTQMIDVYESWLAKYPIVSLEDGLAEHDWAGWSELTKRVGARCQLVGDDLFVTNVDYLQKGISAQTANSILIKVNQIGTVTETLATMKLAAKSAYTQVASHRSGETEDTFIADLAVGTDCGQIKTGSLSRTDRIAKYNQLLRIEAELGAQAKFAGKAAFKVS